MAQNSPRFGRLSSELEPEDASTSLLAGQSLNIVVDGESISIEPDEVEVRVEAQEGFAAAADGPYVAALVTRINP